MNYELKKSVMSPLMAIGWNLFLVYVSYFIARTAYFLENYEYFKHILTGGYMGKLFYGSLFLDTPGILYTNVLWIVMIAFPLHWKENHSYQKVCKWLFIVVNALALAVNLADAVYFKFTLKRTTTSVFDEFSNEDNLMSIFGVEILRHWYFVLLAAIVVWGLWKLYFMPRIDIKRQPLGRYYLLQVLSLVVVALMTVSGIRGGYLNHWYQYLLAIPLLYVSLTPCPSRRERGVVTRLDFSALKKLYTPLSLREGSGVRLLLLLLALLLVATAPIGGWRHRDIRPTAVSNANQYTERPQEAALILNTPFTMLRTIGKSVFYDPGYYPDKAELERIYSPLHRPTPALGRGTSTEGDAVTTPLPREGAGVGSHRKNVVILIVESFGREYIGGFNKEVLGEKYKGYTPFVDSLMQHSVTFRYSFCNSQQSIDGMPSVLCAIPRFIKPFVLTPQAMNRLNSMASCLKGEGYQTAFFHGARDGSMGFNGFANSIGYQAYYGREEFDQDKRFDADNDFDGYWAIWDEPFLQYFALKMTEMRQPFLTTVFTASSHHPFRIPEKYEGKFPEGTMPIHKCIGYTDNALRQFFNTARRQPWFKNTIFVLTSDHTNMREHDEYKSDIGVFCSPVVFYDPSGELQPGMRDAVAQHIDIMPTILGYLGYDKPYVAFGIDLFSTPADDTWAVSEINGIYQYVKYGYVLQFDGQKTRALYRLSDQAMRRNLLGKENPQLRVDGRDVPLQQQMERELKAVIQSYMDRMLNDQLVP